MTVEQVTVPEGDILRSSMPDRAGAIHPRTRSADPPTGEEDGDGRFWPISPPPLISRIFPGL